MTDDMRKGIFTSIDSHTSWIISNYPAKEAYYRCYEFMKGIQFGSQDAKLANYTNALLETYRIKLMEETA